MELPNGLKAKATHWHKSLSTGTVKQLHAWCPILCIYAVNFATYQHASESYIIRKIKGNIITLYTLFPMM